MNYSLKVDTQDFAHNPSYANKSHDNSINLLLYASVMEWESFYTVLCETLQIPSRK